MDQIRKELDDIIEIKNPLDNINFIANLKRKIPHAIKLIEQSDFSLNFYPNYNCYMYALNLSNAQEVNRLSKSTLGRVRPGNEFVKYLIHQVALKEIPREKVSKGDIIIYFDNNGPVHAGKIISDRIISKWNLEGHLWEHGEEEVPVKFGSDRKYFKEISRSGALSSFFRYADFESKKIENEFKQEVKFY